MEYRAHNDYYAINPRNVGPMVEKSEKKSPCDIKSPKNSQPLGDRLLQPDRDASAIKHLRTEQPPRSGMDKMGCYWLGFYDARTARVAPGGWFFTF